LFEAPFASDLGGPDREADLLKAACELSGHRFVGYAPVSLDSLAEILQYIFETWEPEKGQENKPQFSLHFSCHGNDDGIQIGRNFVLWANLFNQLGKAQGKTSLPFLFSISSCGDKRLKLTRFKHDGARPLYVFSFGSWVTWPDAALTWAVLYRKVTSIRVRDGKAIRRMIDNIRNLKLGDLRYHRWDGKCFRTYPKRDGGR
jgi:hypothetical protein